MVLIYGFVFGDFWFMVVLNVFFDFFFMIFGYVFLMAFLGLMCFKCKNFVKKSISYIYII